MFRKSFLQGLLAGLLAWLAAVIYNRIYYFATELDFSRIINWKSLLGYSILVSMVAAFVHAGISRLLKNKAEIFFNLVYSILSFAAVMIPISVSLPLDIKSPELFPGLAVPMVFFPALAWFTISPLFTRS